MLVLSVQSIPKMNKTILFPALFLCFFLRSQTVEWNRSISYAYAGQGPTDGVKTYIGSICSDGAGNIYVGGHYQRIFQYDRSIPFLALYNSSGQLQWLKSDSSFTWHASYTALGVQGGSLYAVVGPSLCVMDLSASSRKAIDGSCLDMAFDKGYLYTISYDTLKKRDLQGALQWSRPAGGSHARLTISDSGYIYTRGGDANIQTCPLTKFDANGNIIWSHGTGSARTIAAGRSEALFRFDQTSIIKANGNDSLIWVRPSRYFMTFGQALAYDSYLFVPEWDTAQAADARLCIYDQATGDFLTKTFLPVDSSSRLPGPAHFHVTTLCRSGSDIYLGGIARHQDAYHAYVSKIAMEALPVKTNRTVERGFMIYPNPAERKMTLTYECPGRQQLSVCISDIKGCGVHTESIIAEAGILNREMDLGRFASGFYIIELKDEQGLVARKKLVIQ